MSVSSSADVIFNSVYINALIPFLTPVAYIMLRRANPRFFLQGGTRYVTPVAMCMQLAHHMFAHSFALPSVEVDALMKALSDGTLTLTGGALLSLLNGDPILKEQDFDVYGHDIALHDDIRLKQLLCHVNVTDITYENISCYDINKWMNMNVLEVARKGQKFSNIICFKDAETAHCYPKWFDLKFCANTLTGKRLTLCNWKAVVKRQCVLNPRHYLTALGPGDSMLEVREIVQTRIKHRIQKYQRRGYHIQVQVNWQPEEDAKLLKDTTFWMTTEEARAVVGHKVDTVNSDAFYALARDVLRPGKRRKVAEWFKECWDEEFKM